MSKGYSVDLSECVLRALDGGMTKMTAHRLFELWLKVMFCPLLRPGQVVILENASFHRKKAIARIVKKVKCKVLFLPPYSPQLNPIEHQWQRFKTRVRTLRRQSYSLPEAMAIAAMYSI